VSPALLPGKQPCASNPAGNSARAGNAASAGGPFAAGRPAFGLSPGRPASGMSPGQPAFGLSPGGPDSGLSPGGPAFRLSPGGLTATLPFIVIRFSDLEGQKQQVTAGMIPASVPVTTSMSGGC
jgi:hypothetical protein